MFSSRARHLSRTSLGNHRSETLFRVLDDPAKAIIEPQCHLHVAQDVPRFKTHTTNLAEILDLIKHNFYT